MAREKCPFSKFQRMEKSVSPGGNVQIQWMIRRDHHRIQTKWMPFHVPERPAQRIDLIDQQTVTLRSARLTVNNRAWNMSTGIFRHEIRSTFE